MSPPPPSLIERDLALGRLGQQLEAARSHGGGMLTMIGPAGIGKTAVLARADALARGTGMRVLHARGAESERDFPFGGALQLLELAVADGDGAELLGGAASLSRGVFAGDYLAGTGGPIASAVHGLYWLTVNLSERQPLALCVDDLHALDDPTLGYLLYLVRRIDELPVSVIAASRPVDAVARPALAELVYHPSAVEQELLPLSADGVAEMIRAEFAGDPADSFVAACARLSGGNPFYLEEVLRSLKDDRVPASDEGARLIASLEPQAIVRSVLLRLSRLGEDARQLARACAILGAEAPLRLAARLAELSPEAASRAAHALAGAAIVEQGDPLRFTHALIDSALRSDMTAGARSERHLRAAEILGQDQAPPERIATHLLHAPAAGNDEHVAVLVSAAAHAADAGMPATAAAYLERALAEPPSDQVRRLEVLTKLAEARIASDPDQAQHHIAHAQKLGAPAVRIAELQLALGRALYVAGRHADAAQALLAGIDLVAADDPVARELRAWFISTSIFDSTQRERGLQFAAELTASLPADPTPGERAVIAGLAAEQVSAGAPLQAVRAQIELAWGDGELLAAETADGFSWMHVTAVYLWGGEFETAQRVAELALEDARRRGSVSAFATASYIRASALLFRGCLTECLADMEQVRDVHERDGWRMFLGAAAHIHALALIERGELDAAEGVLEALDWSPFERSAEGTLLRYAQGNLRLAQGRLDEAIAAFDDTRRQLEAIAVSPTQLLPWWIGLADATGRLGQRDRALELLAQGEEAIRRAQLPGVLARLLVVRARQHDHADAIPILREAVSTAQASQSRLEEARARAALGATLRRAGKRREAVEELRLGLDLADRLGAARLATLTREELRVAGARPRRVRQYGAEALTPSELRIAQLAAGGMTNREIAEALFVTPKTIEYHLRNAFMKLDIASRKELPRALHDGRAAA